ncbi:ATP-dependent DNA helicase RecG [Thioalkalivibrio sulfidiphilus]|uniref:ATP-dependent DNA helicase RecG n=1 Tax=Thioalkalivibrio sulfidiphilus (strain HL-EbGR7) TaxID=396588 RepID=B8GQM8_THISH|nr:ATP-dependent DNA helicase RecG [Thioalkalivibrio sulfidiphilus]ACL74252.1 ATP-dependent DNA helicase RecG [Thioalkalivibrio sulfidiphilus HL-EbGr7]
MTEPVTVLKGVGPKLAEKLAKIGIRTVTDLLFHLPLRYQDRTRVMPMGSLRPGDEGVVEGVVDHAEVVFRGRRMLLVRLSDGTGSITLRFFHFSAAQQQGLVRGLRLRCFGEARRGQAGLEIVHPEYRAVLDESASVDDTLTPIYPTTEGLHQLSLRRLTDEALARLDRLPDWLPPGVLNGAGLPDLETALRTVHRPPPDVPVAALLDGRHPAQRRLAFEELVAHHLSLARLRARTTDEPASPIKVKGELFAQLQARLPFALTGAQQRVIAELSTDMARPHPMLRLVQGDVGAGKTLVAVAACLHAVEAGYQAAVMAPTEILAEQHFHNFGDLLAPLGVNVAWLSGKLTVRARREALAEVAEGRARVAVGTHALFQEDVAFDDLALVVIDEQHRFGVHQRMALREKGNRDGRLPHQLIMTATPIPRTLAMTAYADLDYSVIDELPPGRTPIRTVAVSDKRRHEVVERISGAVAEGRQAYWVCTLIEESEALQAQAAEDTFAQLTEALPHVNVGLVHGRMKPRDKESVMARFKAGEIQLLVATTVIEVGVDVPNASLMIIENAERLGLAQLHQLRGRVGRGTAESSCVLLYRPPLSDTARKRLDALRATTDGFEIARIDLELRGPGEVLGTRQTGDMQFRIADLLRDQDLLDAVKDAAGRLMQACPENVEPLIARWLSGAEEYGRVG